MGSVIRGVPTEVNMSGSKAVVLEAIKKEKVVIFSKTYCPYCTLAKEQFKKLNHPFFLVELDNRDDGDELQDVLSEITGARTVPRVFIDGKCIGGGTDVKKLYESGSLKELLNV